MIIQEGGDKNPEKTVVLDRESRKYIHVRVINRDTKFDNGKKIQTKTIHPIEECTADMFKTPFEKDYFKFYQIAGDKMYCVNDPKIYF